MSDCSVGMSSTDANNQILFKLMMMADCESLFVGTNLHHERGQSTDKIQALCSRMFRGDKQNATAMENPGSAIRGEVGEEGAVDRQDTVPQSDKTLIIQKTNPPAGGPSTQIRNRQATLKMEPANADFEHTYGSLTSSALSPDNNIPETPINMNQSIRSPKRRPSISMPRRLSEDLLVADLGKMRLFNPNTPSDLLSQNNVAKKGTSIEYDDFSVFGAESPVASDEDEEDALEDHATTETGQANDIVKANGQGRLLLVSLLENFCDLYDQDPEKNKRLFLALCKRLKSLGVPHFLFTLQRSYIRI